MRNKCYQSCKETALVILDCYESAETIKTGVVVRERLPLVHGEDQVLLARCISDKRVAWSVRSA